MEEPYKGGCACGDIRYEIRAKLVFMNDCQCRDCQRASGTGHGSYLTFEGRSEVTLRGDAQEWSMLGDSGSQKARGFCRRCGSPVYMTFAEAPDHFTIHASSLDDPGRYQPQAITYRARAHAWDIVDPAIPAFKNMPE